MKTTVSIVIILLSFNSLIATQMNVLCELFATPGSAQQEEMHTAIGALRELIGSNDYLVPLIWKSDYSPSYSERTSFYGVQSEPYAVFGGSEHLPGTQDSQYSWYYDSYAFALSNDSPVELSISSNVEGTNLVVTTSLEILQDLPHGENIIGIALTKYRSSHYYIIVEEYAEHFLIQSNAGEYGSYTHYFPLESAWDLQGMHLVAFVQSSINERQVYQSVMAPVTPNAVIQGSVYNYQSNEPISGALIKAGKYSTLSNDDGTYQLNLLQGTYDLDCKISGFYRVIKKNINMSNSEVYNYDVYLESSLLPPSGLTSDMHPGELLLEWNPPTLLSPIIEGFESGTLPMGWETSSNGLGWQFTDNGSSLFWLIPPHSNYAVANDDQGGNNNDGSVDYLDTPGFNLSNADFAELNFEYFFEGSYSHIARVLISTDNGQSWDLLGNIKNYPYWMNKSFDLTPFLDQSSVKLRFHSNDNNGAWASGWAIDDFHIEQDPGLNLLGYNIYATELQGPINGDVPVSSNTYNPSGLATGTYHIYTTAVYNYGESDPSNEIAVNVIGIDDYKVIDRKNAEMYLTANPNPFNPSTNISFELRDEIIVNLSIFNIKGQLVKNLIYEELLTAGTHNVLWDGTNNNEESVNSGIFFCKIKAGANTITHKVMLMK